MMTVRRGRKRLLGKRKNGRLTQRRILIGGESIPRETVESNQRHGRWQRRWLKPALGRDALLDPDAECPLGVLKLTGEIDEQAYQNGVYYRETAVSFRVMMGLPSGLPKLMGAKGISHYMPDEEVVRRVRHRYHVIRRRIMREAGTEALALVHRVCSQERGIERDQFDLLKAGLRAIRRVK